MKRRFLIPVVLIFVGSIFLFADIVPPSKNIKIRKTGDTKTAVIYSHSEHAAMIGDKAKDCTNCHNAVKSKNDAHKYCAECHVKMKSGPGLAKCNDCHKPAK
jgi:nitrate/TMAO reductase-like tetraheme cytochrome c subunit